MATHEQLWIPEDGGFSLSLEDEGSLVRDVSLVIRPRFDRSTLSLISIYDGSYFQTSNGLLNYVAHHSPDLRISNSKGIQLVIPRDEDRETTAVKILRINGWRNRQPFFNFGIGSFFLVGSESFLSERVEVRGNVSLMAADVPTLTVEAVEILNSGEVNMEDIRRIADYYVTATVIAGE